MNPSWPPLGPSRRYPPGTNFDIDGRPILPWDGEGNSYETDSDVRQELREEMRRAVTSAGGYD